MTALDVFRDDYYNAISVNPTLVSLTVNVRTRWQVSTQGGSTFALKVV